MTIVYAEQPDLAVDEFADVLRRAGLQDVRPVGDAGRLQALLAGADLIVTARDGAADGALVGVARCVTDQATVCLCADVAVDEGYRAQGLGSKIVDSVRGHLPAECRLYVAAGSDAAGLGDMGLAPADGVFEVAAVS